MREARKMASFSLGRGEEGDGNVGEEFGGSFDGGEGSGGGR